MMVECFDCGKFFDDEVDFVCPECEGVERR